MSAFRKGDHWQPDEIDALVALIPLERVYDLTTDEALALLRERGEMTDEQADEALSLLRFGHRITDSSGLSSRRPRSTVVEALCRRGAASRDRRPAARAVR